jgi:DNA polymerase (family 10)
MAAGKKVLIIGMDLADALALAADLRRRLRFAGWKLKLELVGSARRGNELITDIDFLVVGDHMPAALRAALFADVELAPARAGARAATIVTGARAQALPAGPRRRSLLVKWLARAGKRARPIQVDLFFVQPEELPYALFHFTGSRQYNIRTRAHARARGWRLNQYGLYAGDSARRVKGSGRIRSERDLAAFLGVSYRAPDNREK